LEGVWEGVRKVVSGGGSYLMMVVKRVLCIRLSSKYRDKIKRFVYDLFQFRNLLRIFILEWDKKTGDIFRLFNPSLLYSLIADKMQTNKSEWQRNELEEVKEIIEKDEELKDLVEKLKEQKRKVRNAWVCQKVVVQEVYNLKSWARALKEYKKNPEKFRGRPGLSKPRKLKNLTRFSVPVPFEKDGRRLVLMLRTGSKECKAEKVKVLFPEGFDYKVKEVRLVYDMGWVEVYVVYEKEVEVLNIGVYLAGIDIGLDNLLSVVSDNPNVKSFIVSGKELKSYNRWWNKKVAEVKSHMDMILNMMKEEKDEEKRKILEKHWLCLRKYLWNLCKARDRKLNTWMHQITRRVADLLYETGHKVVYVGRDAIDKNGIPFSKVVNQNYVYVPHRKLVDMLKYKCQELGIEIVEVDEKYTSKASPVSDDVVEIQGKKVNGEEVQFSGKRVSRGLYRDLVLNKVFNADLVGAMNILKVGAKLRRILFDLKTLFVKLCNPVKFKLYDLIYRSNPESLFIGTGIGDSKPAVMQEALAPM
jgi:IS605 OrfB family transposase